MPTGLNAQIGYAVETTPGTYETVARFFEFVPPLSLRKVQNMTKPQGIRANRLTAVGASLGTYTIEGATSHELTAESIGILLEACIDGTPATTGAGPYEHVFTPGAVNSLSAQVGLPSASAVHPVQYTGLRARSWTLTVDPQTTHPVLTVEWIGLGYDDDGTPSLASASYATFTRFTFAHASFSVAGSPLCVDTFTFNGTTGWEIGPHQVCAERPGGPTLEQTGLMGFMGTATYDLANLTQMGRLYAGTQVAISVTFNAGSSAILTLAGNAFFSGDPATIEGTGKTKETINFEFVSATSDAAAFTATLTNGDSSA